MACEVKGKMDHPFSSLSTSKILQLLGFFAAAALLLLQVLCSSDPINRAADPPAVALKTCVEHHAAAEHGGFELSPPSCDKASDAAAIFDAVYDRGFLAPEEWEQQKPFDVTRDQAGNVIVTGEMLRHYYTYGASVDHRFSLSGGGSQVETTEVTRSFLEGVIAKHKITSMLDAPCGDVNWQFYSPVIDLLPVYVGLDVASFPIAIATARYGHHSNKRFANWDISACPLPQWQRKGAAPSEKQPFELINMRDVVQHMPLRNGMAALRNVVGSGARFLVTTTFPPNENGNVDDLRPDAFYENIMTAAPFNFPDPLECVKSHPQQKKGRLSWLWGRSNGYEGEKDLLCIWEVAKLKPIVDGYPL